MLRLVLASRADPPLPLARLRARGQLAELRERDLRFTMEESAALLRETSGLELPASSLDAVATRTEGWVAGLQLAALSLHGHPDPAGFVATFSGSDRYVLDYLAEEVLDRQPEPLRLFLLDTSVLERLSGPLCDAVTGRTDSQRLLEQAERANLFLVPLDGQRRWWRYHRLFADLLRARLRQTQPERVGGLHQAAAAWCERNGLVDDAIRHALAAGDQVWAARLIERHFDALLRRAEGATVDRWVAALPAELVRARPRLLVAQAVWALLGGRVEEAEPLVDQAETALESSGDEPYEPSTPYEPSVGRAASRIANLPASIALVRAELARRRGDAEGIAASAQRALAHLSDDDRALRLQVDWFLAVADWFGGRLASAEAALAGVVARQRAAGESYLAVRPACDLGQVQRARGRLAAALGTYERALEIASDAGRPLPPAGMAQVGMAEVLSERGELEAALDRATEGVRLCRQLTYTLPLLAGLAVLAWTRQALGDTPGAMAALAEAERADPSTAVVDLLNPVPALRARLALASGEVADARGWVQACGLAPGDRPSYPHERGYLVLARVLLAEQAPAQALGLLERLGDLAAVEGRTGSLIEVRVLSGARAGGQGRGARRAGRPGRGARPGRARGLHPRVPGRGVAAGRPARPARHRRAPGRRPGPGIDAGHGPAAQRAGARGARAARRGQVEPGDRRGAGGGVGHRQEARQPRPGQARRGQPHPGRRARSGARAARVAGFGAPRSTAGPGRGPWRAGRAARPGRRPAMAGRPAAASPFGAIPDAGRRRQDSTSDVHLRVMAGSTPVRSVLPVNRRTKGTAVLRILGLEGSPTARLVVGVALVALGVWRHAAIAVVVGAGLVVAAAAGVVSSRHPGREDGQGHGEA
jgi:tetratricopeptide (TPR) repeat protein